MTWFSDTFFKVWRPQLYWRLFFENIFGQDDRITPAMVSEYSAIKSQVYIKQHFLYIVNLFFFL